MKTLTPVGGFALAAGIAVLAGAAPSQAAFHLSRIDEVLTNYGGDSTAQFVEIRMLGAGQNFTNGTRLATFDATGAFIAQFLVNANVPNSGPIRWIMATSSLVTAAGPPFTADFVIPAILPVSSGMVCWGATSSAAAMNPASTQHVDCLAYGSYTGPTPGVVGTPTDLEPVGHSLQRISDAFDNATAFVCDETISPENNAGASDTLPATLPCGAAVCGDGFITGAETCDDGNMVNGDCCDSTCMSEPEGQACPDDGDACTSDECNATGMCIHPIEAGTCIDHYLCYKGGQAKGETKFTSTSVNLIDQLENRTYDVKKVTGLCNPATKIYALNTEPPGQPTVHHETYQIKLPAGQKFTASNHETQDQFGTLQLTVKKPDSLLVRAGKIDLGTTFTACTSNAQCGMLECIGGVCIDPAFPTAPPNNVGRDNFKCYQVSAQKGQPKFTALTGGQVEIDDQFSGSALFYDVVKPTRLCTPVDKAGDNPGAEANTGHLVCYQVKLTKFPGMPAQPKFVPHKVAVANTNFPDTRLDVKSVAELCVPALKDPP